MPVYKGIWISHSHRHFIENVTEIGVTFDSHQIWAVDGSDS